MIFTHGFESLYTFIKSIENLPFDKQEDFLKSQKADEGDVVVVRKDNGGFELSVIEKAEGLTYTSKRSTPEYEGGPAFSVKEVYGPKERSIRTKLRALTGSSTRRSLSSTEQETSPRQPGLFDKKHKPKTTHDEYKGALGRERIKKRQEHEYDKERGIIKRTTTLDPGTRKEVSASREIPISDEKNLKSVINELIEKAQAGEVMPPNTDKRYESGEDFKGGSQDAIPSDDGGTAEEVGTGDAEKSIQIIGDALLEKGYDVDEINYILEKAVERRQTSGGGTWSRGPGKDYISKKDEEVTGEKGHYKQIRDKKTGAVGTVAPTWSGGERQSVLDKEGKITESYHRPGYSPSPGGPVVDVRRDVSDIKPTSKLRYAKSFADDVFDLNKTFDEYFEEVEKGAQATSKKVSGGKATQIHYETKPETRWTHPKGAEEKRYRYEPAKGEVTVRSRKKGEKDFKERTIDINQEKKLKEASLTIAIDQLLEKAKAKQYDEKVVRALKKKKNVDNPFALATAIKQGTVDR